MISLLKAENETFDSFVSTCHSPYEGHLAEGYEIYSWVFSISITVLLILGIYVFNKRRWHPVVESRGLSYAVLVGGCAMLYSWGFHCLFKSSTPKENTCLVVMASTYLATMCIFPSFGYAFVATKKAQYNKKLLEMINQQSSVSVPVVGGAFGNSFMASSSMKTSSTLSEAEKTLRRLRRLSRRKVFIYITVASITACFLVSVPLTLYFCTNVFGQDECTFFKDYFSMPFWVGGVVLGPALFYMWWFNASINDFPDRWKSRRQLRKLIIWALIPASIANVLLLIDPFTFKMLEVKDEDDVVFITPFILMDFSTWNTVVIAFIYPWFKSFDGKTRKEIERRRNSGLTLTEILEDEMGYTYFKQFLVDMFCVENIYFYQVVRQYKAHRGSLSSQAKNIYKKFIKEGSPYQVNISYQAWKPIQDVINDHNAAGATDKLFDEAYKEVMDILRNTCLPRFKTTPLYAQVLDNNFTPDSDESLYDWALGITQRSITSGSPSSATFVSADSSAITVLKDTEPKSMPSFFIAC
eukprot:maker-scaffold_56-snap-gene-1.81-mRNA-1 protein AED:0.04 eAED:0.04 QI:0/0.5/0.33/1/0/0/3/70/524